MSFALVLGGGGITGAAWETGVLKGLRDSGIDLTPADLIIGTSAGAIVGSVIAGGETLDSYYARQTAPVDPTVERMPSVDMTQLFAAMRAAAAKIEGLELPQSERARVGQVALAAQLSITEDDRLRTIASRIGVDVWPNRALTITAVACDTGEFALWTKTSGVPLVGAVASSCAVPLVYPPITIRGRRYIDGGVRSANNVDLAVGFDRVVVIAPIGPSSPLDSAFSHQVEYLRARGSVVSVIEPDTAAKESIGIGPGALDPARRRAAAEAGRRQGSSTGLEVAP